MVELDSDDRSLSITATLARSSALPTRPLPVPLSEVTVPLVNTASFHTARMPSSCHTSSRPTTRVRTGTRLLVISMVMLPRSEIVSGLESLGTSADTRADQTTLTYLSSQHPSGCLDCRSAVFVPSTGWWRVHRDRRRVDPDCHIDRCSGISYRLEHPVERRCQ